MILVRDDYCISFIGSRLAVLAWNEIEG